MAFMVMMTTEKNKFFDIWEKDGVAQYSSEYYSQFELFNWMKTCNSFRFLTIGVYQGNYETKLISRLQILSLSHSPDSKFDLQIRFKFVSKIPIQSSAIIEAVDCYPLLKSVDNVGLIRKIRGSL